MNSLIYSLNATVPVFLVIVLGYFLRRVGVLNEAFVKVSNDFNFKVTLPVLIFCDMAEASLREEFSLKFVLYCMAATTGVFLSVWLGAKFLLKDKAMVGAFVQGSYRSSIAVLGVAFITTVYGDAGMAPQMIIGAVPLYNIFAVLVLTFESGHSGALKDNLKRAVKGIVCNPILIAVVLGMLVSLLEVTFSPIAEKTLTLVGNLATPQALICIGAGFEGRKALKKLKPTLAATMIKLLVGPAIFGMIAVLLGFRGQALLVILIMLGSPTTPSSYVMAKNMGGDEVMASSIVVSTTVCSAFSLTFWIFLFRYLAFL